MFFRIFSLLLIFVLSGVLAQSSSCGFVGGFALRVPGSTCPADAPVYCGTGLQVRCCPSGFTCAETKYCCQNGQDCTDASEAHPQCPASTWSIWAYNSNGTLGWCCEPNYFGFAYLDNSGVGCQPVGQTINTATYHTVSQLQAKALTCATSSSSSSASSSASSSTLIAPATPTSATSTSSRASSASLATVSSTTATSSASQFQTSAPTSGLTSSSTATSSSTSIGTSTTTPAVSQSKSSSFGTGAIAGVAVGGVAIVILLILAGWYIGRRSSKKKAAAAQNTISNQSAYDKHSKQWSQPEKVAEVQEMPYYEPVPVHEIGNFEPRATYMPGRHEMP